MSCRRSDAVFNLTHIGDDSGRVHLVWRFVLEHLPAVLAKASPRARPPRSARRRIGLYRAAATRTS